MIDKKEQGLYQKLAEIMGEIGKVEKRGYNAFHNYHYVREGDLTDVLRDKLSARGIVIIPSLKSIQHEDTLTTANMMFTFVDSTTGERHEADWAGEGDDKGDKGLYKAYTGSLKYFLMKMFLISQGDDPEGDVNTDRRAETKSNQAEGIKCPECGGAMWDNRESKRNPRAPDYKCKKRDCDGAVWEDSKRSEPVAGVSLGDAAMNALREQIKAAMQALNEAGDVPEWTVQRVNELSKTHFGDVAARLDLDNLGQLAEMFSQRLEMLRKQPSGETDIQRKAKRAWIENKYPAPAISMALKETFPDREIGSLSLDELQQLENEIIPF